MYQELGKLLPALFCTAVIADFTAEGSPFAAKPDLDLSVLFVAEGTIIRYRDRMLTWRALLWWATTIGGID
jgi:hypothetical protein